MRRSLAFLLAGALGGCSLALNYSEAGLPCDDAGKCLDGYLCNASNQCVLASDAACSPACGAFENCVRQTCIPTCEGRPCGAAQTCEADTGACTTTNADHKLGATCQSDDDCSIGGGSRPFCLMAFGSSSGMCTSGCVDDGGCNGNAPSCTSFQTTTGSSISLCAPSSFIGCTQEKDCSGADLSCGVFAIPASSRVLPSTGAFSACRTRNSGGQAIGETCAPGSRQCANGLCARMGTGSSTYECLTTCAATDDCTATLGADATCLPTTFPEADSAALPRVLLNLCIPGGGTTGDACSACHADAPYCTTFPDAPTAMCATLCSDSASATSQCPKPAPGGRVTCVAATANNTTVTSPGFCEYAAAN